MNKCILSLVLLLASLPAWLPAQELTSSPFSSHALGDIFSGTTTRNASMGGISIATDNYFSVNRANPASYGDIYFTTMDFSGFGHLSSFRTPTETEPKVTAGFQDLSFAFPSNKNLVLAMGFSPFTVVGYDIVTQRDIELGDTTFIEDITYTADGGLNKAFIGGAFRMMKNRLRIGANMNYTFGNIKTGWLALIRENDSTISASYRPITINEDAYIQGFSAQLGVIYEDTLKKENLTLIRFGATYDFDLSIKGDRFKELDNGQILSRYLDEEMDLQIPSTIGVGVMINRPGKWSLGIDGTYQDWGSFQYFSDETSFRPELRLGVGGEVTPKINSFKYHERINYRFGAYWKQSYLNEWPADPVQDYGVTVGFGLPAGLKGNSRLNQGRGSSRISFSFELGRRGNVNKEFQLEELYARIRLGITLNSRWFVQRVVD